MSCVIGIDVGTSGVRTIVMNKRCEILSGGSACLFADLGDDHRSPLLWWQGIEQALVKTLAQIPVEQLVAICIDGTSGTVLPVDALGNCLAEPKMYNDAVEDGRILASIASLMPSSSAAGGATSGLAKALYFSALKPAHIIHQADWIVGKFTNDYTHTDANNALKSGYDPVTGCWPDWITETGFNTQLFPVVSIPGTPLATVSEKISRQFSISDKVQIIAGTTDGCASFLATGASDVGDAVTALGSTLTIKLLSDKPVFAPEYGVYSHRIGDKWLAGGASNSGGRALAQFFTTEALSSLSSVMDTSRPSGLDYYPLPAQGERFPINDPQLQPRTEPRPDDDILFLQGLLEGISAIELLGYQRLMDNDAPQLRSICTVGGGSTNQSWTSIRQRMMVNRFEEVVFRRADSEEAAAGTARLAVAGANEGKLW